MEFQATDEHSNLAHTRAVYKTQRLSAFLSLEKINIQGGDENRAYGPTDLQDLWHTGNVR
jgi:hypothetical protein